MFLSILFNIVIYREVFSLCNHDFVVNISAGRQNEINLHFNEGDYFEANGTLWGCICNIKICFRKCCGENEFFNGKECEKSSKGVGVQQYLSEIDFISNIDYHVVSSDLQCDAGNNFYRIQLEDFTVHRNGSVLIEEVDMVFDLQNYCIETASMTDGDKVIIFVCGPSDEISEFSESKADINTGKVE